MPVDTESAAEAATIESQVPAFRTRGWLLLGHLFRRPPDAGLLARIADDAGLASGDGDLAAAWSALATAAAQADVEALDDEFHDLFIGLGRGELVPYASWYRTGFLMDRPLVALRRDLGLLGFERQPDVCEPEDHAGALADVMALLADPAEGQDDSTQRLFFREHVDSWMPSFFNDLQTAKGADFYREVGRFGAAFLEFERAWLQADDTIASAQAGGTGQSRRPSQ
ncbi:MAG: molecular chaperone TorD family protein [Halofilum sp. (in: g-proteobacteria)]|nr:molecular chaperone TorD family protein [Halofilum sp. (in: g-proteobacteria)]